MNENIFDMDWFCDNCRVHLNTQKDFNTTHDIWQCKCCGFINNLTETPDMDINSLLGDLKGTSMINLFED